MIQDFSVAYADVFRPDGSMIPVTLQVAGPVYAPDKDGLLATALACDTADGLCMISLLFPMPYGAAETKCRQKKFPIMHGDYVTVTSRIDEVVGNSGERYSRFEASRCEITPKQEPANAH